MHLRSVAVGENPSVETSMAGLMDLDFSLFLCAPVFYFWLNIILSE